MENVIPYTIALLLCIWYVLSMIRYLPNIEKWIISIDTFFLVPQWSFFAPEPNQNDYYLYYRTYTKEHPSPWRIVNIAEDRKWFSFIWNPGRRNRKAFFDLCQSIMAQKEYSHNAIRLSMPYLLLLNYISFISQNHLADKFQYAIGGQALSISQDGLFSVFVSDIHPYI